MLTQLQELLLVLFEPPLHITRQVGHIQAALVAVGQHGATGIIASHNEARAAFAVKHIEVGGLVHRIDGGVTQRQLFCCGTGSAMSTFV